MVELTVMEKEIKKLLKKHEEIGNDWHLTPTQIKKIKNKRGLVSFLKNPKGKHVVWMYELHITFDLHSTRSKWYFDDEKIGEFSDDMKFTGKWYPYD